MKRKLTGPLLRIVLVICVLGVVTSAQAVPASQDSAANKIGDQMIGIPTSGGNEHAVPSSARTIQAIPATLTNIPNDKRPSNVPADFVLTPNGYTHPSCVYKLEQEEIFRGEDIVQKDGSTRPITPCFYSRFDRVGQELHSTTDVTHPPADNGWLASVSSVQGGNSNPPGSSVISLFADWTVPNAPLALDGQTLYLFPGLQSTDRNYLILQPVLAFNGFNDNRWTIASWNCCFNGNQIYQGPYPTSPGHAIAGGLEGYNCTGDYCANWYVVTYDITANAAMVLNTTTPGMRFNWLIGGAFEVYNVRQCKDFPDSFNITFSNLEARAWNGSVISPAWTPNHYPDYVNCGVAFAFPTSRSLYPSGTAWSWMAVWYGGW